jgi:hypothetical protein
VVELAELQIAVRVVVGEPNRSPAAHDAHYMEALWLVNIPSKSPTLRMLTDCGMYARIVCNCAYIAQVRPMHLS